VKDTEQPFTVKRSATGLGLFATRRIPKGKKIVEYIGPRVPNEIVDKSNGKYFFGVTRKWSIDGSGRDNVARYVNHSCAPNAEAFISKSRVWIWSCKTIRPGEEIVYDYGEEYFDGIIKDIGCKCAKCAPRMHRGKKAKAAKSKRGSR